MTAAQSRHTLTCLSLAAVLGLLFGAACDPAPAGAQTDGSAEPTILRWRIGAYPADPGRDWKLASVQPTEDARHGTLIAAELDGFRWVEHVSGPIACIYTATPRRGPGGKFEAVDGIGGGRDCSAHVRDNACGYFEEGWTIFAASGGSCSAFGIAPCSGVCW